MPLYYFRKFDFFPEKAKKLVDISESDVWLYGGIGLIIFVMAIALIVVPAAMLAIEALGIELPFSMAALSGG